MSFFSPLQYSITPVPQGREFQELLATFKYLFIGYNSVNPSVKAPGGIQAQGIGQPIGGKVQTEIALSGKPQIVATRPNAMSIQESAKTGEIEKADVDPGQSQLQFVKKALETGKVELTEADVVVSGGRGMGGDDYTVVEDLAEALGGAVGAIGRLNKPMLVANEFLGGCGTFLTRYAGLCSGNIPAAAVSSTHRPCSVHANRNCSGRVLISSKRLSLPALEIRINRKLARRIDQTRTIAATSVARRSRSPDSRTAATVTVT